MTDEHKRALSPSTATIWSDENRTSRPGDRPLRDQRRISLPAFAVFVLAVSLAPATGSAAPIFVESFDNGNLPGPTQNSGAQFQTGLDLSALGDIAGWTESNFSSPGATVHAVDLIPGGGTDFAVMFFSGHPGVGNGDIITLTNGIAANELGIPYAVDFMVSPAVYIDGTQTTTANDSLLIEILRADDSVLASYNSFPGPWAGAMSFINDGFSFIGDGTGLVRIRIASANPGSNTFAGAIDNLDVAAVPEPSSVLLWTTACLILGGASCARHYRSRFAP